MRLSKKSPLFKNLFFQLRERVYIVPTRFGVLYAIILLLMLLAGAIYSNNLVYLYCFILISLGLVLMVQTNENVRAFKVKSILISSEYAGHWGRVHIVNSAGDPVDAYKIRFDEGECKKEDGHLYLKMPKRGFYQFKRIRISSNTPVGLFRAWKWLDIDCEFYIYPEPIGERAPEQINQVGIRNFLEMNDLEFQEHRPWDQKTSLSRIDWKVSSKRNQLYMKHFSGEQNAYELFDLTHVGQPLETSLQQIAKWIQIAKNKSLPSIMILNDRIPHILNSESEYNEALRLLATYPESP